MCPAVQLQRLLCKKLFSSPAKALVVGLNRLGSFGVYLRMPDTRNHTMSTFKPL